MFADTKRENNQYELTQFIFFNFFSAVSDLCFTFWHNLSTTQGYSLVPLKTGNKMVYHKFELDGMHSETLSSPH